MKKLLPISLLLFCPFILSAQDSLRLTINLDGFKKKDQLILQIDGVNYGVPTDEDKIQVPAMYLEKPQTALIFLKNRYGSVWLENGELELTIAKHQFPKNLSISGSKSEDLWNEIIAADQDEKVKLLEANIDHPAVESYMSINDPDLKPDDLKRLRAEMSDEVNDFAKYHLGYFEFDKKEVVKEGEQMFDFVARTSNEEVIDTRKLRGKYLLLDFAGTGCSWCWVAYPKMSQYLPRYSNLSVLTFNDDFNVESWEMIAERKEIDLPWPVLWKAENKKEIFSKYGINVYPTYVLISPEGKVLEYWKGGKESKIQKMLTKYEVE